MPWGAAIGAGVSALANHALSSGNQTNGGAGTQTVDKSPWAPAAPWLTSNLASGQALQGQYAAQPFSPLQNQAYQNQANQSAYMRAAVPSLLGQIQSQQVGFDRSNPNARPNAFSFDGLLSAARDGSQAVQAQQPAQSQGQGLLSLLTSAPSTPLNLNPAPAPAQPAGKFAQQGAISSNPWDPTSYTADAIKGQYTGGYGAFKYGDQPQPGTQAYADMNAYKNYGGADPLNIYGWNPPAAPYQQQNAGGA